MEKEVDDLIKNGVVSVTHLDKGQHKKSSGPMALNFAATAQVGVPLR